jgi:peroxiredoxin
MGQGVMQATIWLIGCVLAPAQPLNRPTPPPAPVAPRPAALRGDWVLTPKLARGQELVYRGTYTESAGSSRVEFQRSYRVESRTFALEPTPRGMDIASMTLLYTRESPTGKGITPATPRGSVATSAVRLERLSLDLQGKLSAPPGLSLAVPLDGAPTLEVGAFVEWPRGRLAVNQGWEIPEAGRPLMAWRVVGTEAVAGQTCVKVVGVQKSDDWEQPRADRAAWRREEVLWISPRDGFTMRLERTIEQREPARREVTRRGVLRYDLESSMQYPALMAQDRRAEIVQALKLRDEARGLVGDPIKNARAIAALQRRIAGLVETTPPTPYRACVLQVKRMVEAAGRGEVVNVSHTADIVPEESQVAAIGQPAPQFVASDVAGGGTSRLSKWKGKPIVLVFYNPDSFTAPELLRFAQDLHVRWGKYCSVVGLCVSDDKVKAVAQRDEMKLTLPLIHGGGMRITYKVDTTPKIVVIDAAGLVRGMYFGWGRETANEVTNELRPWLSVR